jgi:hypothetical protein
MKPLFEEKQRFTQWWLWTIIVGASVVSFGFFGNALYTQLVLGKPWGDKPMPDEALIIMVLFNLTAVGIMLLIFFNAMLEIVVDKSSLSYRYFPLLRRWRRIERENIQSFETRDFYLRGHGFHIDLRGNKRISVQGNTVIEITMTNGKKLRLGTQKPGEFLIALNKMKNRSDI